MIIQKVINNNVISALDKNNKEVVVMGKGIGFQKKPEQSVEEDKVEKVFRMENEQSLNRFKELLVDIPLEYVQVSNEIISYAKKYLGMELNQNVYITLTDHISFAITRLKEGMIFQNALVNEIGCFYPSEYAVGLHALELIHLKTGTRLPNDEAASIAIHLVNAEYDLKMSDVSRLTGVMQQVLQIIKKNYKFVDDDNFLKTGFETGLKFLVHRLFFDSQERMVDRVLEKFVKENYPEEYRFVEVLGQFLEKQFQCKMQDDDKLYLTIDLRRIIKQ